MRRAACLRTDVSQSRISPAVALARDLLITALGFCLPYWAITSYEFHVVSYRDALSLAMLVVGSALVLTHGAVSGRRHVPPRWITLAWLGFFLLGLASAWRAEHADAAFSQLRLYFSVVVLGYGFRLWLDQPTRRTLVGPMLAFCLAHGLILILIIGYATGWVSDPLARDPTAVPYHGNIRHVAYHGMLSACFGLVIFAAGGPSRLLGLALAALSIFGLVFLGQRGGLGGLLAFLAIAAILPLRMKGSIMVASLVMVFAAFLTTHALEGLGVVNRFSGSLVERSGSAGVEIAYDTSGRREIWVASLQESLRSPLLGLGPDGYRFSSARSSNAVAIQPHSALIQALLEFGVLGLIVLSYFVFRVGAIGLRLAISNRMSDTGDVGKLLWATCGGFLAYSLVDGLFYHPVGLLVFTMLSTLTFAALADDQDHRPPG